MSDRVDLIAARERLGLSRRELGKAIGVVYPMIFRVETGQQDPSLAVMRRWVEALGPSVTLDLFRQPPVAEPVSLRLDRQQRKFASQKAQLHALDASRQRAEKKYQDMLARFNALAAQLEGEANDSPLHQNAAAE
jgi:transcriptional regulator with XRE-family HTH domain